MKRLDLNISVNRGDYKSFGLRSPSVRPSRIRGMMDTGAQSCLWSLNDFLAAGFAMSDLVPVTMDLEAANKSPITIEGAVFLRLSGSSPTNETRSCATMVYVSRQARGFFLSMEAMIDLGIISRDFPTIGAVPLPSEETKQCCTNK